jgi:ribonuclease J
MRIITASDGRVIVALFASNIARIQVIVDIAKEIDKKIIFDGKSIEDSVRIASELGYLDTAGSKLISIDEVAEHEDEEIVIITTGTQGEPMSALARMSAGTHRQIKIKKGDTVVLSSKLPRLLITFTARAPTLFTRKYPTFMYPATHSGKN